MSGDLALGIDVGTSGIRAAALGADGVVVGSALVTAIKESLTADGRATPETAEKVTALVQKLAQGLTTEKPQAAQ